METRQNVASLTKKLPCACVPNGARRWRGARGRTIAQARKAVCPDARLLCAAGTYAAWLQRHCSERSWLQIKVALLEVLNSPSLIADPNRAN